MKVPRPKFEGGQLPQQAAPLGRSNSDHRPSLGLCLVAVWAAWWLGVAVAVGGQLPAADRELFAQTKARADKGDAEAQLTLGSFYVSGMGVKRDLGKAAAWHRKAAEQGLARGQYQLGLDYANGFGVKPDERDAVLWFRKAADQGLAEGELYLGLCYLDGVGVTENGLEAMAWFRKAAGQDFAYAKYEIGKCYLEGKGVSKEPTEGVVWVKQAAEQGFALAQNLLGQCYERGTGLGKDPQEAYKWYALAAAQDDAHAAEIRISLAKLEALLTPEQVAQAQRFAHGFKPGTQPQPGIVPNAGVATNSVSTGLVSVLANDESCEILVDGSFVGNSPAKLPLTTGAHVIEVRKTGFEHYRRELNVGAGSELTLRVILQPEKPK